MIGKDQLLAVPWSALFGGAPEAPGTGRAEQRIDAELAVALAHEPD